MKNFTSLKTGNATIDQILADLEIRLGENFGIVSVVARGSVPRAEVTLHEPFHETFVLYGHEGDTRLDWEKEVLANGMSLKHHHRWEVSNVEEVLGHLLGLIEKAAQYARGNLSRDENCLTQTRAFLGK